MLQLRKVSKSFGELQAVKPVDLDFSPGQTTVLLGPSGCGKSTVLRLVVGLLRPDAGSVLFDGKTVEPDDWLEVRRRLGYVIQDGGLFPHLTARRNITLMARHLGWEADRIDARVEELRDLTHLAPEALERYPVQISGGQQQRVSLMRALFLDPEVLLLDEPLGALDPMIRSQLQTDLREIFSSLNKTVILVTHDLGEAAFLGDQLVLLRAGEVVQKGTLQDFVRAPADDFVREFVNAQRSPLESISEDGA